MNMNETPEILGPPRFGNGNQSLESRFKFKRVNEITGAFVLIVITL